MSKRWLAPLLALLFVCGGSSIAQAHTLVNPYAFANTPSYVGGEFYFLAYAQIDGCYETPESTPHKDDNCGGGGIYTTGFTAKVKSRGQMLRPASSTVWISFAHAARAVTMGAGFGHQTYGSSFGVTATAPCLWDVHGNQTFRTESQLGWNWHGVWVWTPWAVSQTMRASCP